MNQQTRLGERAQAEPEIIQVGGCEGDWTLAGGEGGGQHVKSRGVVQRGFMWLT